VNETDIEPVQVWRGAHGDREPLFGPLPGFQNGNVVAYEFELPSRFEPRAGRTRVQRTFVLLDVGVSFADVCWIRESRPDGVVITVDATGDGVWYVDLISVKSVSHGYELRDLYIDVMVPHDGRHSRMLDLDDYADAIAAGALSLPEAVDGLRRWQAFLDRYLHADRFPQRGWTDFPPAAIARLAALPGPFQPVVRWEG
jgi:hypothetical protein